jgi:hypothetical protein
MKLSVVGLWRDSEKTIDRTLTSLEKLSNRYNQTSFYFYENDSIDNTKNILNHWIKNKNGKIYNENINSPKFGSVPDIERLILLSYYRNKAKTLLSNDSSEYTLLIDTDIIFDLDNFIQLYEAMTQTDAIMVVANTRQYQIPDLMENRTNDSFYDVFALRDSLNNSGLYFTDCPFMLESDRALWLESKPIKISSGFGGFALIKTNILKKQENKWSTCGHSEHVNFCYNISRYGSIYIIPDCQPKTDINLSSINLDVCKQIAINQKNKIEQINQIYNLSLSKELLLK